MELVVSLSICLWTSIKLAAFSYISGDDGVGSNVYADRECTKSAGRTDSPIKMKWCLPVVPFFFFL